MIGSGELIQRERGGFFSRECRFSLRLFRGQVIPNHYFRRKTVGSQWVERVTLQLPLLMTQLLASEVVLMLCIGIIVFQKILLRTCTLLKFVPSVRYYFYNGKK